MCQKQKAQLHPRKSRLVSNVPLYLCNDCDQNKREPRYLIVLAGRDKGADYVANYVLENRYVGREITVKELLVKKGR